jgi:thioredoxin 1
MGASTFEVNEADFSAEVLESTMPVLVDFGAEWCAPCKMLDPIVDQIADEYADRMRVAKIDADANPGIVMKYGIMGMPTLLLFKNGEPVERISGFKSKSKILDKLTEHL